MGLSLRQLTDEECAAVQRRSRSRTAAARTVARAQIIATAAEGKTIPAVARALGVSVEAVRRWVQRFNTDGLAGLEDAHRSGRPHTYPPEQVSELIATVLTKPGEVGLPFANWTLDRLVAYLAAEKGITMKRSRAGEIVLAEGVRWRTQETWFGERVDPAFAEKRGPSSSSTPRHQWTA